MELGFEGILETILVGSIASLCLLSLLFMIFGHVLRIDPIRRIAQFALYEQQFIKEEKAVPEPAHEGHLSFALLLLIAVLYGLGATVESITHDISKDTEIKAEAFVKVGRGQVEGQMASPDFARFVTDHLACRATGIMATAGEYLSPCQEIHRQAREFYYSAKNTVFQKSSFGHELSKLESRIDFVRSAFFSLAGLAGVTLIATILAFIFELVVKDDEHPHGRLPVPAEQARPTWRQHMKQFAAIRCLLITVLLGGLFAASYIAWGKVETQYDRRVFGYHLSLQGGQEPVTHPTVKSAGESEETKDHHPHEDRLVIGPLPSSPYRMFAGPWQEAFEPSGIQVLDEESQFLVSNDRGGDHPFLLFAHNQAGVGGVRRLTLTNDPQEWLRSGKPKFESLVVLPRGTEGNAPHRVLALVDRPAATGLLGLTLSIDVTTAQYSIERAAHFGDPCTAAAADYVSRSHTETQTADVKRGIDSCTVEGAVVRGDRLLLGIRHLLGKRDEKAGKDGKIPHIPTTSIVGVPFGRDEHGALRKGPAKVVVSAGWMRGPCAEHSGISDMEVFDDNHLLVLTSVELQEGDTCSDNAKHHQPDPVAQVQGALWLVKDDGSSPTEPARLLHRFTHKPEGVTKLADGTALVVFDDDGSRKSVSRAPQTFPLAPSESVYAIVTLPR